MHHALTARVPMSNLHDITLSSRTAAANPSCDTLAYPWQTATFSALNISKMPTQVDTRKGRGSSRKRAGNIMYEVDGTSGRRNNNVSEHTQLQQERQPPQQALPPALSRRYA